MIADPTIVFPIYSGVTHLDFTGPHQFLSRLPGANIVVASLGGRDVLADGLVFSRLAKLEEVTRCDVLCVPGGAGCTEPMSDSAFLGALRHLADQATYVTAVCTGSLVLAAAGLLRGRRAACHWAWREMLSAFGAIPDPGRVVRDGHIMTGGGVTAGIDFSLALIAELAGPEEAQAIQLGLEYAPEPPFHSGRPETASDTVVTLLQRRLEPAMIQRRALILAAADRLNGAA